MVKHYKRQAFKNPGNLTFQPGVVKPFSVLNFLMALLLILIFPVHYITLLSRLNNCPDTAFMPAR